LADRYRSAIASPIAMVSSFVVSIAPGAIANLFAIDSKEKPDLFDIVHYSKSRLDICIAVHPL
jgi:hypothetical protein